MLVIRSTLKEVMENYDPKLSIRKLAKDIDYHFDSVRRMYKDEMVQYPRDLLLKLCLYFMVQPGQLIQMIEDKGNERSIDDQGDRNEEFAERNGNM